MKRAMVMGFALALVALGTPAHAASAHIGIKLSLDPDCSNVAVLSTWMTNPSQRNLTVTMRDLAGSGPPLTRGPFSIPSNEDHFNVDGFNIPASANGPHPFLVTSSIDDGSSVILYGQKRVRLPCDLT